MNPDGPPVEATLSGDHRMARMIIPLPAKVRGQVRSCVVMLSLDGAPPVLSALITEGTVGDAYIKDGSVYFVLRQPMTFTGALRVQLECYSDPEGDCFIARSRISERIRLERSLAWSLDDLPEAQASPGLLSDIASRWPDIVALLEGGGGGSGGGSITYEQALAVLNGEEIIQ